MNKRIEKAGLLLIQHHIDALLISDTANIFYFTGFNQFSPTEREALVLITRDKTYLFTDSRFTGMLTIPSELTLIETSAKTGAYHEIEAIITKERYKELGYEEHNLTVSEHKSLKHVVRKKSKLVAKDIICRQLREIKEPEEVKKIAYANELTDNAFRYIQSFITLGVSEIELADRIDNFFKRNGARSAFPSIVAFGANAAVPHHIPTTKQLTETDIYILFDLGAQFKGYCGDLSRTVFIGNISKEIENEYKAVLESQQSALNSLQNKTRSSKNTDVAARKKMNKHNYPTIPHAVGHGIGLSVHEAPSISPRSKEKLTDGMVVTIEPGLYIQNRGGIRIEDTVLITDTGYELLTHSSKDLTIIR